MFLGSVVITAIPGHDSSITQFRKQKKYSTRWFLRLLVQWTRERNWTIYDNFRGSS
jgi:hypothetical protein